jgi:hypothetical protein
MKGSQEANFSRIPGNNWNKINKIWKTKIVGIMMKRGVTE